MIKGIFFDAAGVLYSRNSHTADFALSLLKQQGFTDVVSEQELARLEELRVKASQGEKSHETYWEKFLLLRGVSNPDQRKRMIRQITDYSNTILPVPGCREALAGLKQRNFTLGIVTDTIHPIEWKMRRLERVGVAEFIDVVACSTALGVHKPDPAIYLNALRQVNLSPDESAFVGHDIKELAGARSAGITTVAVYYDPGAQADYYCNSLIELLTLPIFKINQ